MDAKITYHLLLAYDGTRFFGWQKTITGPSIQESLSDAIVKITGQAVVPEAASRTDRGVHAEGQSVAFFLNKDLDPMLLERGLNAVLPPEIRVVKVKKASSDFHPTFHAKVKEYQYRICLGPVQEPIHRLYSWHFRYPLNFSAMKDAANLLVGRRDFSAFANEPEANPICRLESISLSPLEVDRLQISMIGDRFLYKMARNLVGTLLYVGCGKLEAALIPSILASRDRKKGGVTAPAHGLFLHRVDYKDPD